MKAELTKKEQLILDECIEMYEDINEMKATSPRFAVWDAIKAYTNLVILNACHLDIDHTRSSEAIRDNIGYIRELQTILVKLELNANNN